ncbi:MAG: hypothetical protein ACREFE_07925 [Limisphaerales bacterium]
MKIFIRSQICIWILLSGCSAFAGENNFHAGPLFDQFPLTLDSGQRTEILGPLFYDQQKESEKTWALPPFFSHAADPAVEWQEDDFLYPLMSYDSYGREFRWQFCQLISFAGGREPDDSNTKRFTIFPIYFQQRSPDASKNYTALLPFYGHINNRLFRDKIFFVMLPLYVQSQKKDIVTDNYLYPFFSIRRGNGLRGWKFWPIVGSEHKAVTTQTNGFGDVTTIAGHDKFFALWPFYYKATLGVGTDNPDNMQGLLPIYNFERSPKRDSTSVLWPFFSWIDDRGKKYREWEGPWPFVVIARGAGKTTTRVWPLFGNSHNDSLEDDFYLYPLYKFNRLRTASLDERRTRVMFYLFENTTDKNLETGAEKRRVDAWPFFTYHRDFNGNNRLQILAPIEPVLPDNSGIERNWSPLWSLWRSENNVKTGAHSQSLLWNLYRRETTPTSKKCSLLFGLFQYQSGSGIKKMRLFYIPILKTKPPVHLAAK